MKTYFELFRSQPVTSNLFLVLIILFYSLFYAAAAIVFTNFKWFQFYLNFMLFFFFLKVVFLFHSSHKKKGRDFFFFSFLSTRPTPISSIAQILNSGMGSRRDHSSSRSRRTENYDSSKFVSPLAQTWFRNNIHRNFIPEKGMKILPPRAKSEESIGAYLPSQLDQIPATT